MLVLEFGPNHGSLALQRRILIPILDFSFANQNRYRIEPRYL